MNSLRPIIPQNAVEVNENQYLSILDNRANEEREAIWFKAYPNAFGHAVEDILGTQFANGTTVFCTRDRGDSYFQRKFYIAHPEPVNVNKQSAILQAINEYFKPVRQVWAYITSITAKISK